MNIAVFADLHGRLLLAFQLCARWQRETGKQLDLILQAGDLGTFPALERLDKATRRFAESDPTELGFMQHFVHYDAKVAKVLAETNCPLVFVRGNHEDHGWLDALEHGSEEPVVPVDVYKWVFLLRTGQLWRFQKGKEQITVLGIGRIGAPHGEEDPQQVKYIQEYEMERLYALDQPQDLDVLLTHDTRPGFVLLRQGGRPDRVRTGMQEIADFLDSYRPAYHFFGHYGDVPHVGTDKNGVTQFAKLADLHWERDNGVTLEKGSMGILRWQSREAHTFTVLNEPWLKEYNSHTWRHLL